MGKIIKILLTLRFLIYVSIYISGDLLFTRLWLGIKPSEQGKKHELGSCYWETENLISLLKWVILSFWCNTQRYNDDQMMNNLWFWDLTYTEKLINYFKWVWVVLNRQNHKFLKDLKPLKVWFWFKFLKTRQK